MKIMVTGATGGYGRYAAEFVRQFAPDAEVFGLVRSKDKGADLEKLGVTLREGDYSDEDSLVGAFKGIDRLLFVSVPVFDLQKNVVSAAKKAGVGFIAYTSLFGLEHAKFGLEQNHRATERLIAASGIPHVFLRNCWYLEMPAGLAKAALKTGVYPYFDKSGVASFALKKDLAEAGARLITAGNPATFGEAVDLSAKAVSWREIGEAAAKIAGKAVEVRPVEKADFAPALDGSGISEISLMLANAYQDYTLAGNNGEESANPQAFEKLLGRPLAPLTDALKAAIENAL